MIKGDLGVQRGLLRWFLSLHSPAHPFGISPDKITGQSDSEDGNESDVLPVYELTALLATPPRKGKIGDIPAMPTPFTPSIDRTLQSHTSEKECAPLPDGLNVSVMKTRLDRKKKIK